MSASDYQSCCSSPSDDAGCGTRLGRVAVGVDGEEDEEEGVTGSVKGTGSLIFC